MKVVMASNNAHKIAELRRMKNRLKDELEALAASL